MWKIGNYYKLKNAKRASFLKHYDENHELYDIIGDNVFKVTGIGGTYVSEISIGGVVYGFDKGFMGFYGFEADFFDNFGDENDFFLTTDVGVKEQSVEEIIDKLIASGVDIQIKIGPVNHSIKKSSQMLVHLKKKQKSVLSSLKTKKKSLDLKVKECNDELELISSRIAELE